MSRSISSTERVRAVAEGRFHLSFGKRQSAARFFRVQREEMAGMRVLSLTGDKVETHDVSEVEALSKQDDLLVWGTFRSAATRPCGC